MKKIGVIFVVLTMAALAWWGCCHGSGFGSGGGGGGGISGDGNATHFPDGSGTWRGIQTTDVANIQTWLNTQLSGGTLPFSGTAGTFSGTVTATGGFSTPRQASDSVSGTKGQTAKWYEDVDDGDSQYTLSVTALDGNFTDTINGSTRSSTLNFVTTGYIAGLTKSVSLTHASGVHDGGNDAAIMTDSGESFAVNEMVGMTVYNVTDGSSCTVTANAATTITCTLAGGTDNNWDTNDVWQVGPGPGQAGTLFYVSAASTIRHPATKNFAAGYYVTAAVVLTIEVADTMTITNATAAAIDAGDTIDSPGTAGAFIVLHNQSATVAQAWGKNGTWVDGGAS